MATGLGHHNPVASRMFGAVEGLIGMANQVVKLATFRTFSHPKTGGDVERAVLRFYWSFSQCPAQTFSQDTGLRLLGFE